MSDDLVKGVMGFDSYTLVAKYVGIWLRERRCGVEDVGKALRESAGEPKLFFANYIWSTVLRGSKDLAKKVSIPLILHVTFGPIPEGVTYIMKAVSEGGVWRLIDRDHLAALKLEDLREDDLEPIAKWLSTWHEDLIEETLKELAGLQDKETRNNYRNHGFENFIKALDWGYEKALEEVRGLGRETKPEEVESNLLIFVSERPKHALKPYTNCWKRAALIIGAALAGYSIVPRPEDLPKDLLEDAKYLSDALGGCGIDDYLLVGNKIPPLIKGLAYTHVLTEAFVDKYDKAIEEVNTILKIAKDRIAKNAGDRGGIYAAETLYGLGLASIIAKAVESGKPVGPSDADAALHIASFTIRYVVSTDRIIPILRALEPLRGKAPHRYLEPLAYASNMENLDRDTVRYVFDGLNEVLDNYGDVVKGYARFLVHAIIAYANLLVKHLGHFNREEVGDMVDRVADLLNELGKFKSSLGVIALAYTLGPVLMHGIVREHEIDKVSEVLGRLSKMRDEVQELMRDEEFKSYIESKFVKADEKTVKEEILEAASFLKHALAHHRFRTDELNEAERLFNEVAEESREIGVYENYLVNRSLALRVEAIKDSLVDDELIKLRNEFQQLYEETFSKEHFKPTAPYLSNASGTLGEYLVSLALTGNNEEIRRIEELLEEHWWVLNADEQVLVLTRLILNALLGPRVGLSSELKGKLSVNPEELINAFESDMYSESRPALRVALGIAKPEDGVTMCVSIKDLIKGERMVCGDSAIEWLRWGLVDDFRESLIEEFGQLKELGVNADKLLNMFDEFMELVVRLDGKSLVQLIAPASSRARLALMLHALINGDGRLAKAHALYGVANVGGKLLTRLLLEAYRACCDLNDEGFRRAIAKLFFYYV